MFAVTFGVTVGKGMGGMDEKQEREYSRKKEKSGGKMELYDWIQCVVGALVLGILIFMFGIRVVNVKGSSMWPTLHTEDKILTTNFFYDPKPGDVVVVQTDSYGPDPLVKRVIAVEGQTVDIDFEKGIVYVDGVALDEPYINEATNVRDEFPGEVTVPEGCMFLMGDNRNRSTDSRHASIGMVDERCVIGKVLMVVVPSDRDENKNLIPRDYSRIGSIY